MKLDCDRPSGAFCRGAPLSSAEAYNRNPARMTVTGTFGARSRHDVYYDGKVIMDEWQLLSDAMVMVGKVSVSSGHDIISNM